MNLPEPLPESQDLRFRHLYNWLNRMRDYVVSCTPQFGGGMQIQRGALGWTGKVPPSPPGGAKVIPCVIVPLETNGEGQDTTPYADYLPLKQWSFSEEATTGPIFYAARSVNMRMAASVIIDGATITYDYNLGGYPADTRLATYPDTTQTYQRANPRYISWLGSLPDGADMSQYYVYVIGASTGVTDPNGNPVNFLEVNPRFWGASVALNYMLDGL